MKNLSLAAIIEKNKLTSNQAWLVAMKIDVLDPTTKAHVEYMYLVRNDETVTIEGEIYQPFPFEIDFTERANELPAITVNIQDQTRVVQSYMQNYGGGVGFEVDLMIVTGDNKDAINLEPELMEKYIITDASAGDYTANWTLGVANPLRLITPKRLMKRDLCSFTYKGVECAYAGGLSTCDRTLDGTNGCKVHTNQQNFGGFPGLSPRG